MIERLVQTTRAIVGWNPFHSSKIHPVAEIEDRDGALSFRYLDDDLLEPARADGFDRSAAVNFDHPKDALERAGISRFVTKRLGPRTREDAPERLEELAGWPRERYDMCSDLSRVTRLHGLRMGDGFSIHETFDGFEAPFQYVIRIADFLRHADMVALATGDDLTLVDGCRLEGSFGAKAGHLDEISLRARIPEWTDRGWNVSFSVFSVQYADSESFLRVMMEVGK